MQHTPGLRPKESGHDPAAVRRVSVNCETPPSTQSHIITLVVSPLIIRAAPSNQKSPLAPLLFSSLPPRWNASVFGGRLPAGLPLIWNPRLLSTAGQVLDDGSRNREKADPEE